MTPSEARRRARAIRATARTHGAVTVLVDGQGRIHALPGEPETAGTYTAAADLTELAADLVWLASKARKPRGDRD